MKLFTLNVFSRLKHYLTFFLKSYFGFNKFLNFYSVQYTSYETEVKLLNVIADEICAQIFGSFSTAQIIWYKDASKKEQEGKDFSFLFSFDVLHSFFAFEFIGQLFVVIIMDLWDI